jgi:hypothetical protein
VNGVIDVLPLAATASPEVWALRIDSPRRGFDDLDESPHGIFLLFLDNLDPSPIARHAVGDEDHFAMDPSYSISFKSDGLDTNINFFQHDLKIAWRRARFNRFKEEKEGQNGLTSRNDFVSFNHLNREDHRGR